MPDLSGQIIKGYELQDRIGEGGFGAVYRAVQTAVGREVAIKVILPQYANQPDFIRRFEAEARLVARLEHPYIVSLYDYWRDPSGAYLVLRWLRGGTLRERLRSQGALPAREAARLLTQIAAALTVAHRANIIHRDIKPANILLDGEGNAYLSDFGIALDTVSSSESATPSTDRQLVGSAGYISPEQIKVEDVSPLSDIYSLAIVAWELLAGHHPYADARTSIALFIKHSNEPLPPLPDYPASISAVLQKAAAKKPAERYQDVNEFAQAFKRAILEASLPDTLDMPEGLYAEDYDTSSMARTVEFGPAEIKNPYKGLQAFQEGDAADFFGREALTRQLLQRLSEDSAYARFLAVVGPSGSGKSSVVKAGLLPALRRGELPNSQRWFIVEMLPGADPLTELQDALQSVAVQPVPNVLPLLLASPQALNEVINAILPPRSELVLVIDQFEEVFTQGNSQQRVAFLENLYEAIVAPSSRLRVILTLRADFYDRPLLVGKFSTLIQQRTEVVLPLTVDELERAITAPARQVKVFFQQGLAAQIVSEVNDQPGVLPMLQYALTELFERREGQLLTSAAYQAIGGVLGALARRAEELYQGFDEAEQEATRQLFLRLVTLGEGTEDTRRRALESEILAAAPDSAVMQGVIRAFGSFRLLTFDRDPVSRTPTLEVAHEALIREWRRLRQWLDISRADVRLQRLLSAAAHDWEANARDPSFLLRGGRLVQFEDWFRTTSIALAPLDVTFVQVSIAQRQAEEEAEAERLRKERDLERRARQRLGVLVIVLLLAFTGGVILSIAIFNQSLEAQAARAEALEQADTAVAAQNLAITQERRAQAEADNNATQVALVSTAQADAQDQANLAATAQVNAEKQAQLAATAQNVAEREASSNATQVALVSTAQADAQDQANLAATAQVNAEKQAQLAATAQNVAEREASSNATQVALVSTAQADAQDQANLAATAQVNAEKQAQLAATAQNVAEREASSNATQVALVSTAQADAQRQANLAATAQVNAEKQAQLAATAQNVAEREASSNATQVALVSTAQAEAQNQAQVAATAQNVAEREASSNATQVALVSTAQAEAQNQAQVAATAQNVAEREASSNATQVALVSTAQADAQRQAQVAATAQNVAEREASSNATQVALVSTAQADAQRQAQVAATAQNVAEREASSNATQVALVSTAQADAQRQAQVAATAQNVAEREASSNATQVALVSTAQADAQRQANLAATAQNVAEREASSNATQVALVSTAQADAQRQAQVAATAQNVAEREAQISQSLALAASAGGILEQDSSLALALALQANAVENPSLQAERLLISAVLAAPRKRLDGPQPFTALAAYPGADLRVVSGDLEGQLILWDVQDGGVVARWTAHAGAVSQIAISADGRWIASVGGGERAVRVWEQRGDAWQERLSLPTSSSATALAFSDDDARLASGDSGGNVVLWDTSTWAALQTLPRVSLNAVTSLAYRGGRRDLLVAFEDTLRLWDVAAQRYREFSSELPRVRAVAANRAGTAFLSGGARGDGVPVLYDARLNVLANLPDHQGPVNSVAFSPDGRYTLSASDDFSVLVADSLNGALVRRFAGHNSRAVGAVFSADSRQVVTAGADAALYLWDIVTSTGEDRPYQGQRSSISYLGFDEAGRLLAAADDGRLLTWDERNQPVAERRLLTPTIPQVRYARDGQGRLWLASTDVRRIEPDSTRSLWRVTPSENRAFISDLALSGDGRLLAWGGGYFFRQRLADFTQIGLLQVLDADTGQLVQSFDVAPRVDEDGQTVIQEGTNLGVSAVALSADGALLAAGFQDGRIGLYSVASGALLRNFSGHSAQVNDLAFSADATRLLSGSQDRALILWEVANGQLLRRLVGHSDAVNAVAFSPLDSTVLSGSEDRTLRLWDTETGEQIQFFGEQDVPISAAIYAPDGRSAILGTIDGRVVQTPINTAASLRLWAANNRYIPELTCAQREQYRVLPLCDERANR